MRSHNSFRGKEMSANAIHPEYLEHLMFKGVASSAPSVLPTIQVELPVNGLPFPLVIATDSFDCLAKMMLLFPDLTVVQNRRPNIMLMELQPAGQTWLTDSFALLASWNGDLGCFIVALRRYIRYETALVLAPLSPSPLLMWHAASLRIGNKGIVISGTAGVGKSTLLRRLMNGPTLTCLTNEDWFVMDLSTRTALYNQEVNLRVKEASLTSEQFGKAIAYDLPSAVGPMAILPSAALGVNDTLPMNLHKLLLLSLDVPPNSINPVEPQEALARLKGPTRTALGDTYFNDECYDPVICDLACETSKYKTACDILDAFVINPRSSDYFISQLTIMLEA